MTEPRTLDVALGDRHYPIHIGAGILNQAGAMIGALSVRRAVIVTNATVAAHWLAPLRASVAAAGIDADIVLIPDGETHKNWSTLHDLLTRLLEIRAERSTLLIALGGGVVGDIAGFAAAIYQRGMPFVQIPTTLLAQVDSSVGGKTGVNHPLGKNMIGAFYQPRMVLIDTHCLRTLPDRELSAGLAEIVKHGAIRDADFFAWLETHADALLAQDPVPLTHAIHESCRIKSDIVAVDEREAGARAVLNFGHTFGHAIETHEGYGRWLHGEAVGAGMVLAARLSQQVLGLPAADVSRLRALLARLRIPVDPPRITSARWIELMQRDKKVAAGRINFVLLRALGAAVMSDAVNANDIEALVR